MSDLVESLSDFVNVDIETDFEAVELTGDDQPTTPDSNEKAAKTGGGTNEYSNFPDVIATARDDIFPKVADLLGAEDLSDVTHDSTNRRMLRFWSTKAYVPDTVEFRIKPEPERSGQLIVHVSSEDDENRVGQVLSAHADRYEDLGFDVTGRPTYRIVKKTWQIEDAGAKDPQELVQEFLESGRYEEAIQSFVDLVQITDDILEDSEFASGATPDR